MNTCLYVDLEKSHVGGALGRELWIMCVLCLSCSAEARRPHRDSTWDRAGSAVHVRSSAPTPKLHSSSLIRKGGNTAFSEENEPGTPKLPRGYADFTQRERVSAVETRTL